MQAAGCSLLRKSPSLKAPRYKQTRIIIWDGLITTKPKAANFYPRFWCAQEEVEQCLNCGAPSYFQVSSSYTASPSTQHCCAQPECSFPWVRMEKFAGWRLHLFLQCSGFLMDPYKHKLQQESLQAPPHRRGLEAGECDRMTEDAASCHLLVIPLTQPWKTLNPKLWSRWSEARDPAAGDRQVAAM